jgi:hypothetical protein
MEIQPDYKELFGLLNRHNVLYIIVGSYALAFHGAPRYTGDIDILVKPDPENAKRIMKTLQDFGFGATGLTESDFISPDKIIQLGYPPVRIDLLTSISGVDWETAENGCTPGQFGEVPVKYLGKKEFIINKRATNRKKDQADLEALEEI